MFICAYQYWNFPSPKKVMEYDPKLQNWTAKAEMARARI